MTARANAYSPANLELFREKVAALRRQAGQQQRELARALGIDPQVLSRKLHGQKQAFLTHSEVKTIIKTLATWDAITTRAEAIELLTLMGLRAESFSEQEWLSTPLNRLDGETSDGASTMDAASSASRQPLMQLPAPSTSFVGRDWLVAALLERLRQPSTRLLTLLGTAGVGKTRMAVEIARAVRREFADGAFFVSLAAIRDAALVPSAIMQALRLAEPVTAGDSDRQGISSPEDVLKAYLQDKELLLVLDNMEHIPDAAPFISDLLNTAARLKVMVTSRAILHLYGEYEFDIPPLDVCDPDQASDPRYADQFPAIRLFVERAQAVNPAFQITPQNAATIARICARLDGLPLAIELAAVRAKTLALPAILKRLTQRSGESLTFLRSTARDVPQRQQTLQQTLDWSYELLDPRQQRLFRRLGVFLGGWTLEAAQSVTFEANETVTPDDTLELMESLLDQSLVKQIWLEDDSSEESEPRYYTLETIREYALGQQEVHGEREDMQRRHAAYYLALAERIETELAGREQARAVSKLAREEGNLRAALAWAIERGEGELTQRLCGALGRYWEARTQFQEAHRWIDAALAMTQETPPAIRAKLLMAASRLFLWEASCERSRELAQEALTLYEAIGDRAGTAEAIFQVGDTWHMQGDYAQATHYLEESLRLLQEQEDWRGYAFTLSRLGAMATLQGNFSQAWIWLKEALPLLREYSEPALLNVTLVYLGVLALVQGDIMQSIAYLREGVLLAQQTGNRYTLATALIAFGCLAGTLRGPSYAARICSAAESLFHSLNTVLPAAYRPLYDTYLGGIKSQVDETTWAAWWAEGQALSQEDVIALALDAIPA